MKKLFKVLSNIIYSIFLLAVVSVIVAALVGIRPYKVLSGSMEPTIKTGSICFVDTNYEYSDVKEGDIIAFSILNNTMVTHRVIAVTDEGFETKGDNNANSDGISTTEANYRGRTVLFIPYIGYLLFYIRHPATIILFAVAIVVSILIGSISKCLKENG